MSNMEYRLFKETMGIVVKNLKRDNQRLVFRTGLSTEPFFVTHVAMLDLPIGLHLGFYGYYEYTGDCSCFWAFGTEDSVVLNRLPPNNMTISDMVEIF